MSSTGIQSLSRRQFLAGCGAVGASAVSAPVVGAMQNREGDSSSVSPALGGATVAPSPEGLGMPGQISPAGQQAIADVDRQRQQQRGAISQTRSAADLGVTPDAGPINETLSSAVSGLSNTRIEFPGGQTFSMTGELTMNPEGPIELIGNGTRVVAPSGFTGHPLKFMGLPGGSLIEGITLDMTERGTVAGIKVGSDATAELRNCAVEGVAKAWDPERDYAIGVITPVARSESSTIRVTNFKAIGGTSAGMHSDSGPPDAPQNQLASMMGLWIGRNSTGTIQFVNSQLRGWQNGTYAGRTSATVEIRGGTLWNCPNTSARVGGGAVIDGTTIHLDDRQWSMDQNPGPYSLGEHQGVHAIRVETGGEKGNQDAPCRLVNLRIKGMSMGESAGLIDVEGSGPTTLVQNCYITNHMEVPAILGEEPGSQASYAAAPETNIMVENSLVDGATTEVMDIRGRPQSRIQTTCVQVPGAGPDSITGAQIGQGVSFGQQCASGSGLSNQSAVGSGANVSVLPAPSTNSSASARSSGGGGGWGGKLLGGLIAAPLAGIAVMALPLIIGLLVLGGVTFGGLLWFFKKLSD